MSVMQSVGCQIWSRPVLCVIRSMLLGWAGKSSCANDEGACWFCNLANVSSDLAWPVRFHIGWSWILQKPVTSPSKLNSGLVHVAIHENRRYPAQKKRGYSACLFYQWKKLVWFSWNKIGDHIWRKVQIVQYSQWDFQSSNVCQVAGRHKIRKIQNNTKNLIVQCL